MGRKIGIWVTGLISASLAGGLLASNISHDASLGGFISGACAFACFRLWMGEKTEAD